MPAWADWTLVGEVDGVRHYIDFDTIRKNGDMRRVWDLANRVQRGKNGEISNRARREFDCKEERMRTLILSIYNGPMASGETLFEYELVGPWSDIRPGTIGALKMKIVCNQ